MKYLIALLVFTLINFYLLAENVDSTKLETLLEFSEQSDPSDSLSNFFAGKLYFDNELFPQAIERLTDYVQYNPHGIFTSEALYVIGRSYAASDSLEKALQVLKFNSEHFTYDEFGIKSLSTIGDIYFDIGDYTLAKLYYTHFIYFNSELQRKDEIFLNIEKCNYYLGLYNSPAEIYKQYIQKYPKSELVPELKLELAKYYFSIEDYEGAIEVYNNIIDEYSGYSWVDSVYFHLTEAYKQIGKWDKSIETINQLVSRFPNSPLKSKAYRMLIDGFIAEKKFLFAIDTLNSIIENSPIEQRNTYYEILAQIYEELGLNQELVYIYQIMIQQETDVEKAALLRLKLETIKKRTGESEDSLKPIDQEMDR